MCHILILFCLLHLSSYIMSSLKWAQRSVHYCNPSKLLREQCRNSIKDSTLIMTFKYLDPAISEASPISGLFSYMIH